jgi:hypothetical protein
LSRVQIFKDDSCRAIAVDLEVPATVEAVLKAMGAGSAEVAAVGAELLLALKPAGSAKPESKRSTS